MADPVGPRSRTIACASARRCPPARVLSRRAFLASACAVVTGAIAREAHSDSEIPTIGKPPGRPRIKIDRVVLPTDLPHAAEYLRHLKYTLRQEARRADWGAGRGSTIAFRFMVEELTVQDIGSALRVRCSARGELPRRRTARSRLVYSGDPKKARELVRRVLSIVARGVITRLADLERARRAR